MLDVSSISQTPQSSVEQSITTSPSATTDIVVTARRKRVVANGQIKPIQNVDQARIKAYGARSIGDLMNAMSRDTQSPRGNQEPIILVNGRPVADSASIKNFPPEALTQLEIYPEDAAPYYGQAEQRRVINLVTKHHFTSMEGEGNWQTATDGGQRGIEGSLQWSRVRGDSRASLNLRLKRESLLLESERGIRLPSAVPGQPNQLSPSSADISLDRSLLPRVANIELNGNFTTPFSENMSASANVRVRRDISTALFSSGVTSLATMPLGDSQPIFPNRVPPLKQTTMSTGFQARMALNGQIGRWLWSTIADIDHNRVSTLTNTAISLVSLSEQQADHTQSPYPSINSLAGLVSSRPRDHIVSQSDTFSFSNQFNGPIIRIAKRDIFGKVELSWTGAGQHSSSIVNHDRSASRNVRQDKLKANVAVDIPIARPGSIIGEVTSSLSGSVVQTAGFGLFTAQSYAINWLPVPALRLSFSTQEERSPPDPLQLSAPIIETPQVSVFDYVKGEDVRVLAISGGNPALKPEQREIMNLDLAV